MKNGIQFLVVVTATLAGALANAGVASTSIPLDQDAGSVEFRATGRPSAIKIVGKGKGPMGSLVLSGSELTGVARFELSSLETGIEMRDRHMKEKYLEVQKYPEATLELRSLHLPEGLKDGSSLTQVPFTANLALHGKEKPVTGVADLQLKDGKILLSASFGIRIADYGIALPKFAGITMADEVQISVQSSGGPVNHAPRKPASHFTLHSTLSGCGGRT